MMPCHRCEWFNLSCFCQNRLNFTDMPHRQTHTFKNTFIHAHASHRVYMQLAACVITVHKHACAIISCCIIYYSVDANDDDDDFHVRKARANSPTFMFCYYYYSVIHLPFVTSRVDKFSFIFEPNIQRHCLCVQVSAYFMYEIFNMKNK